MKLEPKFAINYSDGKGGRCNALPFCFCPLTVFSIIFDALANSLSADRTNVSVLIIVNDGWDLRISSNLLLGSITRILMSRYDRLRYNFGNLLPSNYFDFGNLAWIENATQEVRYPSRKLLQLNWPIRDATKCCTDVECKDKLAVLATVRRPGWHPGCGRW